jgi:glycosyltransferase involved in cell wall biosynthesis
VRRLVLDGSCGAAMRGMKVYEEARTAHLERLQESGIRLLYRSQSYDFDPALAIDAGAERRTRLGAAWDVFRSDATLIELNEPLFIRALPLICLCIIAGRGRILRGGSRPKVVAYAIENIDMAVKIRSHAGPLADLAEPVFLSFMRMLLHGFDRIVFGAQTSKDAYEALLGTLPDRLCADVIPAIEPICPTCVLTKAAPTVLFLGALEERKGVDALMAAWPAVTAVIPDATLAIFGKGPLQQEVMASAGKDHSVSVRINPPRVEVHMMLAAAKVLVLPSRSSARWREQVGLPIVEGLSHGCRIVSAADTGLAGWLRDKGHHVVEDVSDEASLARAIVTALIDKRDSGSITRDLPTISGRRAAEELLWSS